MNKAECRKYAGEPLHIRANSGLLCADQIEWLTTARVRVIGHRRTLVLQVYSRAGAAQGDLLPKWTVFQHPGARRALSGCLLIGTSSPAVPSLPRLTESASAAFSMMIRKTASAA